MYLTVKQQAKHLSQSDYNTLKELCHFEDIKLPGALTKLDACEIKSNVL